MAKGADLTGPFYLIAKADACAQSHLAKGGHCLFRVATR